MRFLILFGCLSKIIQALNEAEYEAWQEGEVWEWQVQN